jgi:hypothetical protein
MLDRQKTNNEKYTEASDRNNRQKMVLINGHEFELRLVTVNESKAGHEARKYRKHGFHTRVIKSPEGMFSVYRRHKTV